MRLEPETDAVLDSLVEGGDTTMPLWLEPFLEGCAL
jgi:hypothetical protein